MNTPATTQSPASASPASTSPVADDAAGAPAVDPVPSVDLYGAVHKGLRWALVAMLTRVGQLDPTNKTQVWELLDDLDGVLFLCTSHIVHEERNIHPALERRRPGCTAEADAVHEEHRRDLEELQRLADALLDAAPQRAPALCRALYLRLSAFIAADLMHMHHEETVLMPLCEALFSIEELVAIHDQILASIGPEEMAAFMRVMIPANDRATRALMLGGMKAAMPASDFAQALESFRGLLSEGDFVDLRDRLGVAAPAVPVECPAPVSVASA